EVLLGTPIANRTHRELEGLIGFFVNTLVLRVPLGAADERPGFRELLGRVRQAALDAYSHQDLPFERLVEEVVAERSLTHAPLFQVLFALQNAPAEREELPGLTREILPPEGGVARADLALMFYESSAGVSGLLEYDAQLFDATTAERLLGRFAALLRGALAEPERALWDLPSLLPGERQELLWEWN